MAWHSPMEGIQPSWGPEGIQPSWGPEVTGKHSIRQQDSVSNTVTGTGW